MSKITQADIARELGVAVSTVQRALQGSTRISATMRQQVRQLAESHGYQHDVLAQGLRSGKTRTLGIVFGRVMPHHVSIFTGIEQEAMRHGYSAMLAISDYKPEMERKRVHQLLDRAVDALIVATIDSQWELYPKLVKEHRPVVFFGPVRQPSTGPVVRVDEQDANYRVTQHLVQLGHRRIAYIDTSHLRSSDILANPIDGYIRALKENRIRPDSNLVFQVKPVTRVAGEDRLMVYENGYEAIHHLLELCPDLSAVVCYGGPIAAGVVGAAAKLGLKIPEDLSVASSHDDYLAPFLTPRVTSVTVQYTRIGEILADLAISKIKNPECSASENILIPCELAVRDSTGQNRNRKPRK